MALGYQNKYRDVGLFILRVGIGICFIAHGWGKISDPDKWGFIGSMATAGVGFNAPAAVNKVLGFLAALSEFGGGICLILGFLFRPACILMSLTMAGALAHHLGKGDPFGVYSHALESLIVFVSLFFIGPGKISIERE